MKANRAFRASDDDAVSPVIAVILMVAITVVLAATVYVWVSGFGSSSSQPAKSISLTKSKTGYYDVFTVSSATPGMKWSDLKISIAGMSKYDVILAGGDSGTRNAQFAPTLSSVVTAGSQFYVVNGDTSAASGSMTILDTNANSVMLTINGLAMDAATSATPTAGGSTITKTVATPGTYASGDTLLVTLDKPIEADTAVLDATHFHVSAHSFGTGATIKMKSPTSALITLGTGTTLDGTENLLVDTGVKDVTGAAITLVTKAVPTP